MYPEVSQPTVVGSDTTYRIVNSPVEVLGSGAVAASCTQTAVDEVLATVSIPAGILTANSVLRIEPLWTFPSSANNKILKVKVNGNTIYSATRTTSVKEIPLIVLACRNSLAAQIQPYDNDYAVAVASGTPTTYTIDLSAAVTIEICAQRANGSESVKLEYFAVLHYVGV